MAARVGSFELLVNILRERGVQLEFRDQQIPMSHFPEAVSEIALTLRRMMADEVLVDLADAMPLLSLEAYDALAVYASTLDPEKRSKLQCNAPGPDSSIGVFIPALPLGRFVPLLKELKEHPHVPLSDLRVLLKRHPSTISRQIGQAEQYSLVEKKGGSYRLTEFGEVVLRVFLGTS